jgi:transposase
MAIAGMLAIVGLPFALIPPRNIRDFARAIGKVARNDQHQAGLLAQFAELVHPDPYPLPDEVIQQLHDFRARRTELSDMLNNERHRLKASTPAVHREIQSHIQFLERALKLNAEYFNRAIRVGRVW